ncbi:MAG: hypothetical protein NTU53_01020 [Planctomycetota bacterium]|nr:hypothetical protein [Planctomycetota bacterium]
MNRRIRKLLLGLVAVVALLANAVLLVRGLSKKETDGKGEKTRNPLLAGTATASILAILALLMNRRRERDEHQRVLGRCPVCDVELTGLGKYCAACGSRT